MKILDMHCDTVMSLMNTEDTLRNGQRMVNLEKMKEGDYLLQCFAMFVPYHSRNPEEAYSPFQVCNRMIDRYYQELEKNRDLIAPVFCYQDILDHQNQGIMSSLLTIEEGGVCEGKLEFLRNFYRLGVRMMTLTWNFRNELAYPNTDYTDAKSRADFEKLQKKEFPETEHGLTPLGISFVQEMNRLGMIIDCSHLGDKGFYDVLRYSEKPVVCSHSCARSVCHHLRNLTDDMLLRLKENGGVIGINYCREFVTEESRKATIQDLVRHICYIRDLIGIDSIGLGSDFDGIDNTDIELKDASMMPSLVDELRKQCFSEEDIDKICYRNVLRVFQANWQ